jgi:hypothetical protein
VVCLDRFLISVRGIFRPIMPVGREVLVPPASVTASLVTASNAYKHMFIWSVVS